MTDWLFSIFAGSDLTTEGSRNWALGSEGLPPGWAFFLFLLLAALSALAYWKCAAEVPRMRRWTMAGLRLATIVLFLVLLAKPVLNLTVLQPVRQSLLVLIDGSTSMLLEDQRMRGEDLARAGIAAGRVSPDYEISEGAPGNAEDLKNISRWTLLQQLSANSQLNLWDDLLEKADLLVYQFGRDALKVAELAEDEAAAERMAALFENATPEDNATALGDSLRQVLEMNRGLPVAGVLVITDGASNSGLPPAEAGRIAQLRNIPLFVYGMGVTTPTDLRVRAIEAPQLSFVDEEIDVRATIDVNGFARQSFTATLKVDGEVVDTAQLEVRQDGPYELSFRYTASEVGEKLLEVSIPKADEELTGENNIKSTKIRIMDEKIRVLYIEQDPRWDFRYLLAYLQRDRRLEVDCVLIDSGPGLEDIPDSPFIPELPSERDALFAYEVVILGDVNPADLGNTRMELLSEWVSEAQGGMIFLAGSRYNPAQYKDTPLEALLPVVPDDSLSPEARQERSLEYFDLRLTPAGRASSYLEMSPDAEENLKIWEQFPGVRWTAAVARAKPGASVLLVDGREKRAVGGALMPVMAVQGFGNGETVFIGTDQTYRWRSGKGETYYSRVWNSIMQSLSINRLRGAGDRTQLKVEREQYLVGEQIVISGKVYEEGYEVMVTPVLDGVLQINGTGPDGAATSRTLPQSVAASPDEAGQYNGEFTARVPGRYTYYILQDPEAKVSFEVIEPRVEQMETALNLNLLESMAQMSGGRFLREENLTELPDLITEQSADVVSFRKFDLFRSPWWLALLFFTLFLEWLIRRISHLK